MEGNETGPDEDFVRNLTAYQNRLYGLILSMLPDPDAARDVLQETNVVLWRKYGSFQTGTNFGAWAAKVAYFQVAAFRTSKGRDRLLFDDELLAIIGTEAEERFESHSERSLALETCLERLTVQDREMIKQRYTEGNNINDLALMIGKSANATRVALFRLRHLLLECIQGKMTIQ